MSQENVEIVRSIFKNAALFHVRGGKVTRLVLYWDREPAFAELGLAPGLSE